MTSMVRLPWGRMETEAPPLLPPPHSDAAVEDVGSAAVGGEVGALRTVVGAGDGDDAVDGQDGGFAVHCAGWVNASVVELDNTIKGVAVAGHGQGYGVAPD